MFTTLHELAKQATLMITIAPEGADQLRVNVTPMPFDGKAKASLPQPLSLVATPAEFDADFIVALSTWQSPKRSLIQQAQDAAGAAAPAPALPAPKPAAKAEDTEKPSRKKRGSKGGAEQDQGGAPADGAAAAGEGVHTNAGTQLPDSAVESGASASTDSAAQGVQQVEDESAGDAADVQADPEAAGGAAAPTSDDTAIPADAADQEPVDKFTLDLF